MYKVYVLKSKKYKKSYVGTTNDLERRLIEHNSGQSAFTKRFMPWEVLYHEEFAEQQEAIKREKFLKSSSGRRFLKKIFEQSVSD